MHPSELARLEHEAHHSHEAGTPVVTPGSLEEEAVLLTIDAARAEREDRLGEDFADRRRAFARKISRTTGGPFRPEEIGRG